MNVSKIEFHAALALIALACYQRTIEDLIATLKTARQLLLQNLNFRQHIIRKSYMDIKNANL